MYWRYVLAQKLLNLIQIDFIALNSLLDLFYAMLFETM